MADFAEYFPRPMEKSVKVPAWPSRTVSSQVIRLLVIRLDYIVMTSTTTSGERDETPGTGNACLDYFRFNREKIINIVIIVIISVSIVCVRIESSKKKTRDFPDR